MIKFFLPLVNPRHGFRTWAIIFKAAILKSQRPKVLFFVKLDYALAFLFLDISPLQMKFKQILRFLVKMSLSFEKLTTAMHESKLNF